MINLIKFTELKQWQFIKIKVKEGRKRRQYHGVFNCIHNKKIYLYDPSFIDTSLVYDETPYNIDGMLTEAEFEIEKVISIEEGDVKYLLAYIGESKSLINLILKQTIT